MSADRPPGGLLLYMASEDRLLALTARLAGYGQRVVPVGSLDESLRAMDEQSIALVFVEARSGDSDALEIIRRSKARDASVPVVVLSSNQDLPCRIAGRNAGADDYLEMPIRAIDLEMRLQRAGDFEVARAELLQEHLRGIAAAASIQSQEAARDPLTGLPGRGALLEHLDREYARARRYGHPLTILMLDVDRLGPYQKKHGKEAAERALCLLADVLRAAVRTPDIIARHGNDDFVILATDTAEEQGLELGERLRGALRAEGKHTAFPAITVSIGIAGSKRLKVNRAQGLLEAAERAVAEAKSAGRDQCLIASG